MSSPRGARPRVLASTGRRRRRRATRARALCAVLLLTAAGVPAASAAKTITRIPVSVSVDGSVAGTPVPPEFLGLSFEVTALSRLAGYSERGDFITLLRSLGPGVIRFGGASADTRIAWTDAVTARPAWASGVLVEADLQRLGNLATASGWHVLLTIGLGHYEPEAAAREAAAAKAALGESLAGIELGNEPNAYASHGLREEPWSVAQYDAQVAAYRSAIEAAAPGIPLAGPDVSGSSAFETWGVGEAVGQRPALLTGHHYPLGCEQQPAPSIARLLSPEIRRREGVSLARYLSTARASETPFRLDETNTVSCGGTAGISNTFASALWAVSYITQAMRAGAVGINLQGNPANCEGYTPLCSPSPEALASGDVLAQPEWYALLLAKALIGARPLQSSVSSPRPANLEVSTFRRDDGALQFVIVDDDPPGTPGVAVRVRVGAGFREASILSLTAPSPSALAGVRLGGRAVSGEGSWSAPSRLPHARVLGGFLTVDVSPGSAALLTAAPTG